MPLRFLIRKRIRDSPMLALCLAFAAGASALVALPTPVHVPIVSSGRRVSHLQCVAATEEEKTLLAASK